MPGRYTEVSVERTLSSLSYNQLDNFFKRRSLERFWFDLVAACWLWVWDQGMPSGPCWRLIILPGSVRRAQVRVGKG